LDNLSKHVPKNHVNSDHFSTLQEAIYNAENGVLHVKEGTYLIDKPIKIKSNTTIIAYGATFRRNADINVMFINDSNGTNGGYNANENIKIYGGTFDGSGGSFSDKCTILAIGHSKNILIQDSYFKNLREWHMVELNSVRNGVIHNCIFDDYGSSTTGSEMVQIDLAKSTTHFPWFGPYDNTTCDNILIEKCTFLNGIRAIGTHAYTTDHEHTNIKIINNIFNNMSKEAIYGTDWAFTKIEKNHFTNVFKGIHLIARGADVVNHSIIDNYLSSNGENDSSGIQIDGVKDSRSLTSGVISNNKLRKFKRHSIGVDHSLRWLIDKNDITNNEGHAIIIYNSSRVNVVNNSCYNNNNDISITQPSDQVIVSNNNIQKMIVTNLVKNVFVTNNIISITADLSGENLISLNNIIGGVLEGEETKS